MAKKDEASDKNARYSVAVPNSHDENALYRLGVKSDGPQASFSLGEKGPGGQRLASVYITAEDAFISVDLDEATITVISGADDQMQAVSYDIDVEAMQGNEIVVGEKFSVTFSYNDELLIDETPVISEWLATTGPQYPDLSDRLPVDETVADFDSQINGCKRRRRFGRATRAPRSASHVVELKRAAAPVTDIDLSDEHDLLEPEPIQVRDPTSNKVFVGRIWQRSNEVTTARELAAAGYRIAVVEFSNGEKAILLPHFKGGLGIRVKTHTNKIVERVLKKDALDAELGSGLRLETEAICSFEGDRAKGGPFASPPMKYVVGIGPETDRVVDYRSLDILEGFRSVGDHGPVKERELVR